MSSTAGSPSLTVVVVVFAGRTYLLRCLDALSGQIAAPALEIIVPCDESLSDVGALRRRFPRVQFVCVTGRRTYAELRALGLRHARGDLIALTEDHCTPDTNWCASIVKAHTASHAAVGGAVDKAPPGTALERAIYLSDFSRYMPPLREGPAAYLTDCNVSYKRSALAVIAELWAEEFHETTVNWALRARGESLWLSPELIVRQQRSLSFGAALHDRYAFGRLFASTRVAATSATRRILYAVFSVALPALLVGRVVKNVLTRRRPLSQLIRTLPPLVLVNVVWAWGELLGYLTGRPPRSLAPVGDHGSGLLGQVTPPPAT